MQCDVAFQSVAGAAVAEMHVVSMLCLKHMNAAFDVGLGRVKMTTLSVDHAIEIAARVSHDGAGQVLPASDLLCSSGRVHSC
jgi:hypothetical protein